MDKLCVKCTKLLPLYSFYHHKASCKVCYNDSQKLVKSKDSEAIKAKRRVRYVKNRDRILEKQRADPKVKERMRDYWLRKLYGITAIQYDRMFLEQRGLCAICQEPYKNKKLCVDHCHKTGAIRGLLCIPCNLAIGGAKDRIDVLEKGIAYLKHFVTKKEGTSHQSD